MNKLLRILMWMGVSILFFIFLLLVTLRILFPHPQSAPCIACFEIKRRADSREQDTKFLVSPDVNGICTEPGFSNGMTPLHSAALQLDLEALKALLAIGCDPNVQTHRTSVLSNIMIEWTANPTQAEKCAELLYEYGADVSLANEISGWTPLHNAANFGAYYNNVEGVNWLIDRGAVVDVKTKGGRTPLDFAVEEKSEEIADILRRAEQQLEKNRPNNDPDEQ